MSKKDKGPLQEEQNGQEEQEQPNDTVSQNSENKAADLQAKIDELNEKYLRLYSEFDNYRKRTAKEKIEWIKSAGEDIFKSVLTVLDDFERAIKLNAEATDIKAVNEGVNLIYNKLKNSLTQKGLEEMKAVGTEFNTDLHEAITNVPAPSEDLKGKVIEEMEKGYLLNGKVIRYAKVIVGI